jgi:hypothetical protein
MATKRLTDEQIDEFLRLTRGADSVELKVTVPEPDMRTTIASLGIDALDAQIRQVYFFDTPDLDLNKAGVVVRARRVQRKGDDSVVKLRPVEPDQISKEHRRSPACGVEVDALPGGFVCSASFKGIVRTDGVKSAVTGSMPLRKLFSKEQRAFYSEYAPEGIEIDDLSILGPVFVLKTKVSPEGYKGRLVAEVWLYPDDSRVVELSTKCAPTEAFQVGTETRAFLKGKGVNTDGDQSPKTGKALEFFSKRLKTAVPA